MRKELLKFIISWMLVSSSWIFSDAHRQEKTINNGWEFRMPNAEKWERINIPHTYNLDAYSSSNYYRGKGIYRRNISAAEIRQGLRHYLRFDAASKAADVSLNGRHIASHKGGYTAFNVDITDCLTDGDNILEVNVDNGRDDITPISADFTFWGGIYRDVWLISVPEIHFNLENHGTDGIFISTPVVNENEAIITISEEVTNDSQSDANISVKNLIFDPDGNLIHTLTNRKKIKSGQTIAINAISEKIATPKLWSPENPCLYTITTCLYDIKTGQLLDKRSHKTAFRWFEFDGNAGFSLNGKPYKLRGVNRHQDQWPVGVALDDEAHRRDVRLMKEIGCNFIRISHYPQDDALLDACDELGLLAWEEIPIVNRVPDTPGYDDNCEYNLIEMIRQHYNHPSVIAWGYMNEILLTTPGPERKEWPEFRDRTVRLARRLEARLKEEDPYRTSVMAFNMTNLYNEIGLDLEDVAGWNLYQGWYVDRLEDFNRWCEDQHERYPDHPIIISEWGAGSDRRIHSDAPRPFDFSIEYHQKYIEHYLRYIEDTEWICGCAYWNFIDFNVAARQESMPRVNNKGLFYNDRSPKDIAYYFKAMWRQDIPVVRIASHDRQQRFGAVDDKHAVKIYTNLPEVEMYVNGVSVGSSRSDNCTALFEIQLPYGESCIMVRGTGKQASIMDVMTIKCVSLPKSGKDEIAVNVGSNCYFTSDVTGMTWLPDKPYTEGEWGYISGIDNSTTSEVFSTIYGPLYQTWKAGAVSYRFDIPPGDYEVELMMADMSRPARQQANLLGKSDNEQISADTRFDIVLCGVKAEEDFSPADGERYRVACRKRYILRDLETCLMIDLLPIAGNPSLAGIKIRPL